MIVSSAQAFIDIPRHGYAIDEDVMGCLQVEGLLNFGVWRVEEMKKRQDKQEREGNVIF